MRGVGAADRDLHMLQRGAGAQGEVLPDGPAESQVQDLHAPADAKHWKAGLQYLSHEA